MVEIKSKPKQINVPQAVKYILDRYDINSLIMQTIPSSYVIPNGDVTLEIYKLRSKFDTPIHIELNDEAKSRLQALSSNYPNKDKVVVLSYLIELVCDLSKIRTKDITHALDSYYTLASYASRAHRDDTYSEYSVLFTELLRAYGDSGFNLMEEDDTIVQRGLDEEGIAMFLTVSPEGKTLVQKIDELINNK